MRSGAHRWVINLKGTVVRITAATPPQALFIPGTSGRLIATISNPGGRQRVAFFTNTEECLLKDNHVVVVDQSHEFRMGNFDGQVSIDIPDNDTETFYI
jgi:hypothetical protein